MSIRLMSQVWEHFKGPAGRKLVLLCLADFASDEGIAWPSRRTVAKKSGLSRSQVNAHFAALRSAGILVPVGLAGEGYEQSRRYLLRLPQPETEVKPGRKSAPLPGPDSSPPGAGFHPYPGPDSGPPRAGNRPQSTIEPSENLRGGEKEKARPLEPLFSNTDEKYKFIGLLAEMGCEVRHWTDWKAWVGLAMDMGYDRPGQAAPFLEAVERSQLRRDRASQKRFRFAWEARPEITPAKEATA